MSKVDDVVCHSYEGSERVPSDDVNGDAIKSDITSPAALALLTQAGVLPSSLSTTAPTLEILDIGCGIGQFTEILLDQPGTKEGLLVVAGDVEGSLLDAVRGKVATKGGGMASR